MNTVIFLTQENKRDMAESVKRLAEKQHTKVNGALVICHQSVVSAKEAQKIAQPLIDKFVTGAAVKASTNTKMPNDGQLAVMFSRFVALAYARYPGPWLIIDSPAEANVENWAKAVLDQHNLHGGRAVGMARQDGKTLLTYGPITVQLSVKAMKMLHFSTNESWRSRGRYLLMNAGFRAVDPAKAVFREMGIDITQLTADAPISQSPEPADKAQRIEMEQCDNDQERKDLIDMIQRLTGKRPHHFTGIDKLREMVQQIEPQAEPQV